MTDDARSGKLLPLAALVEPFAVVPPEPPGGWDAYEAKVKADAAAEAEADAVMRRSQRVTILRDAFFPTRSLDAIMKPRDTIAMRAARLFLSSDRSILVLSGGTGTGKTSAASWCALEAGGSQPGFLRTGELEGRGRYDRELRPWLRERSMLVIDDMGVEVSDASGVFVSLLDEVMDLFYGDRKRIVLTTNLSATTFFGRYGARIQSRLHQTGEWSHCGDQDLRQELQP